MNPDTAYFLVSGGCALAGILGAYIVLRIAQKRDEGRNNIN